jgi:DNA-binding transcriptional LysR family regulator
MELRHLRYFIAAVEEGSFLGAAERMNVAQPALSRRIRDLEATLACSLLTRSPRGVAPTRAGAAFYREARALLEGLDQAAQRARRMGLDQGRLARMGLVQTSSKYGFIRQAIADFRMQRPDAALSFLRSSSQELALALRDGRVDLTLLYERHLGAQGFGERLIHRERYVVAAHPRHQLAHGGPVELAALAGEPLVWLARRDNLDHHDALMQRCRLHGLEPVIAHAATSHEEQIELTVASEGACLTPASTMLSAPAGDLAFRPLEGLPMELHLSLAWDPDLAAQPGADLLARLNAAIDAHQEELASGACAWAQLVGHQVVLPPDPAEE